jgi:hypothetical protein
MAAALLAALSSAAEGLGIKDSSMAAAIALPALLLLVLVAARGEVLLELLHLRPAKRISDSGASVGAGSAGRRSASGSSSSRGSSIAGAEALGGKAQQLHKQHQKGGKKGPGKGGRKAKA